MSSILTPLVTARGPLFLRRSPFETILGVIPIPFVLTPPTIQTEYYLESVYFQPQYFQPDYSEPIYPEVIYREEQYNEIF